MKPLASSFCTTLGVFRFKNLKTNKICNKNIKRNSKTMTFILSPIAFSESSDNVANLQAALVIILPVIGFTGFKLPASEIQAKSAFDGTVEGVKVLQEKFPDNYNPDLLVDELMAKLINGILVKIITVNGTLTNSNGQGLSGHSVLISEFDIDQTVEVGSAATISDGTFTSSFLNEAKLQNGDNNTNPDLLFKARGSFGQSLLAFPLIKNAEAIFVIENGLETAIPRLAPSKKAPIVLMNCPPEIELRIVVITAQSNLTEFERLLIQLQPFMRQVGFADLKEDDENFQISFLSRKGSVEKVTIEILKNAFIDEHKSNGLPAWAFFGLANLPLAISEWLNKSVEEFTTILKPLQPSNSTDNISGIAQSLITYAKGKVHDGNVADLKVSVSNVLTPVVGS